MAKDIKTKKIEKAQYFEGIGRRKTATARVRVFKDGKKGKVSVLINGKDYDNYFPLKKQIALILTPLNVVSYKDCEAEVKVSGGGLVSQAEAVRLGISRALILMNPEWRKPLKAARFLTRDSRMVERKKVGSRKARRPQQWRKR